MVKTQFQQKKVYFYKSWLMANVDFFRKLDYILRKQKYNDLFLRRSKHTYNDDFLHRSDSRCKITDLIHS